MRFKDTELLSKLKSGRLDAKLFFAWAAGSVAKIIGKA